MARRGFAKTVGVALVAVVVVGFLLYSLTRPTIGWPAEDRRVVHPGGFSVIIPPGWERHLSGDATKAGDMMIMALPSASVGNPGMFNVGQVHQPLTADELAVKGYAATTFQGKPAFEKWRVDTVDFEHTRSLVFERDGAWFDLKIRRSTTEAIDRGAWLRYAESFRIEPTQRLPSIRLPHAATQPATSPAP